MNKTLTRLLSLTLALLMALSLAACGGKADQTQSGHSGKTGIGDIEVDPAEAKANPRVLTWLYNADFSAVPLEDYEGTLLDIHARLPLDLKAMDEQISPYSLDYDHHFATIDEAVKSDVVLDPAMNNRLSIGQWEKHKMSMELKLWCPMDQACTLGQCLQNNWWYLSEGQNGSDVTARRMDIDVACEGDWVDYKYFNAILAKFGTPHRIYAVNTKNSSNLTAVREETFDTAWSNGEQIDYMMVWVFPKYVLSLGAVEIIEREQSGSDTFTCRRMIDKFQYQPIELWEKLEDSGELWGKVLVSDDYIEPHELWGK